MTQSLHVRPLPGDPVDLIGDVHGELSVLNRLIRRLGYDESGVHPEGRKLVFLGDLIDRGEDSVGVVNLVRRLVAAGHAHCILGNHEFNIINGDLEKSGNAWFSGREETFSLDGEPDSPEYPVHSTLSTDSAQREAFQLFFAGLPAALERSDLRVVHATWHQPSIDLLREDTRPIVEIYADYRDKIRASDMYRDAPDRDTKALLRQNQNPVKVLTSGLECKARKSFYASGKTRTIARQVWWDDYRAPQRVVFGHYWRDFDTALAQDPHSLFRGIDGRSWLGPMKNAMCIDYQVGKLYRRRAGLTLNQPPILAALRIGREGSQDAPTLIWEEG